MAQPLRRSAAPPASAVPLSPVPSPAADVDGQETTRQLLRSLEKIASKGGTQRLMKSLEKIADTGGTVNVDPPPLPYGLLGSLHVNVSQTLQEGLWRFGLSTTARDVLDHMTVNHDDQGIVRTTQSALAAKFGCSQSKVSRAIGQLSKHRFTWKERRGEYRLNPLFSYRFSSRKHARLLASLRRADKDWAENHMIVIPEAREATR